MYFKVSALLVLLDVLLAVPALNIQKRLRSTNSIEINYAQYHGSLYINLEYRSAAALVATAMLLTAAHHIDNEVRMLSSEVHAQVLLGSRNLTDGILYEVRRISHHEGFTRFSKYVFPDDIAVIHLKENVEISDKIRPMRIVPPDLELPEMTNIYITGYGFPHPSIQTPTLLRLDLRTADLKECQKKYLRSFLKDTNLCAFPPCNKGCTVGDGGAPVFAYRQRFLIAIVSDDNPDHDIDEPIVFTKLSSYWDYIKNEIDYYKLEPELRNNFPSINFDITL